MHRLLVLSDLHLELSDWAFPASYPPHDVAVFAGDVHRPLVDSIHVLARARDEGPLEGSQVVLVPGNHEFYGFDMNAQLALGREAARETGIHLLDCDEVWFGDLRVLGCTLWTDYDLYGTPKKSMAAAAAGINDHRVIRFEGRTFAPRDALAIHRRHLAWLAGRLRHPHGGSTVVVTHHGISHRSVHPRYGDSPLNPAFSSDLDALVLETAAAAWIHGHTHSSFDYMLGTTRVVCNPKGYGPSEGRPCHENEYGFDPVLVIEVD